MNDKTLSYNIDLYLDSTEQKIKEKKSYERSLFAGLSIFTLFNIFTILIRNPVAGLIIQVVIIGFFLILRYQFNQKHEEKFAQNKTNRYLDDIIKEISNDNKENFEQYIELKLKDNKKNPYIKKEIKKLYLKINKRLKENNKEPLKIKF